MECAIRARASFALRVCLACAPAIPALAAERPSPQPQREAIQPCPRQGPGFVRVPGSSTCIRVSGRAVGGVDVGTRYSGPVTAGQLSIDTHSESDLGPVRAFVRMGHGRP
jgi:hypothetical protein